MLLELREDFAKAWNDPFGVVNRLDGAIYRHKEGRKTLRFEFDGRGYFLKLHRGVGWKEVIKNLVQFRLPVVGAENEWRAIRALHGLGVGTMTAVGFGKRGCNPARRHSFLITEELVETISLEDFCRSWSREPPSFRLKKQLIEEVAGIGRTLHVHGINHRDFYICHFLLRIADGQERIDPERLNLFVIDLHRAQIRRRTPERWLIKDLASLYYSSVNIGLTKQDVLRFIRRYTGRPLRQALVDRRFWHLVKRRAIGLHVRDAGCRPNLPI